MGRRLVPIDAFFEFTGLEAPKSKWRFTPALAPVLGVTGLIRDARSSREHWAA